MNDKEPPVYLQTWPTTCSVSCMMMVMSHIFGDPLARRVEGELRHDLKMRGYDIIPAIDIALHMARRGLTVTVRHDTPHKFWKIISDEMPEDFLAQMRERHEFASSRGLHIKTGDITPREISDRLREGNLIILGIDLGGVKHAILLYKIEGDRVTYVDPLSGRLASSLDRIMTRARMDVGTWYISANRRESKKTT